MTRIKNSEDSSNTKASPKPAVPSKSVLVAKGYIVFCDIHGIRNTCNVHNLEVIKCSLVYLVLEHIW